VKSSSPTSVASTTTKPSYLQAALIGGAVAGVLSSLPVINLANACCCLWIVSGGLIAAYVMQQDQATPLTPGDGALVGLLAGIVGAVVALVVSIPIDLIAAPLQRGLLERLRQSAVEMPPEVRDAIDNMIRSRERGGMVGFVVVRVATFFLSLFVGGAVSTVGGLLGAVIFRRSSNAGLAPPPPPEG
jgi:hypothetical protein